MSKFKILKHEFEEAKHRCTMANKHREEILEQMVQAGLAKVVPDQDGIYEYYIVGEKARLDEIQYISFYGEDYEYWGIDAAGRDEAKEQGCSPEEFCDVIVLCPGEKIDMFMKGYR